MFDQTTRWPQSTMTENTGNYRQTQLEHVRWQPHADAWQTLNTQHSTANQFSCAQSTTGSWREQFEVRSLQLKTVPRLVDGRAFALACHEELKIRF